MPRDTIRVHLPLGFSFIMGPPALARNTICIPLQLEFLMLADQHLREKELAFPLIRTFLLRISPIPTHLHAAVAPVPTRDTLIHYGPEDVRETCVKCAILATFSHI